MVGVVLVLLGILAVVIIGFVKAFSTARRVDDLEWEIKSIQYLRERIGLLESELERVAGVKLPLPRVARPAPEVKPAPASAEEPLTLMPASTSPGASSAAAGASSLPATPEPHSRTRDEWEAFVGGKLLNRIGALALILAFGFFLKYAFDNNWISESVRVLIGTAAGIACLAGAFRTQKRGFEIFAQGLLGAGIAILYLSIYASFSYYHLVPQVVAFALMSLVTVIALGQGFYYNSIATALLGWAGGFLTPILLSTGTNNEIGLFTYLTLLNIGLLAVALQKPSWWILEPFSFGATWIYYIAWFDVWYAPEALGVTIFFVTVFWGLFVAVDAMRLAGMRIAPSPAQHPIALINALAGFVAMFNLIDGPHHAWMGTTTLLMGAAYAGISIAVRRHPALDRYTEPRNDLLAILFLLTATAIEFSDLATVRWWTLEAAALMLLGITRRAPAVWRAAPFLLLLAFFKLLITHEAFHLDPSAGFTPVWNLRTLTFLLLALAAAFSVWLIRRSDDERAAIDREWLGPVLEVSAAMMMFLVVTVELNDGFLLLAYQSVANTETHLLFLRLLAMAAAWMLLAVGINEIASRVRSESLAVTALLVGGCAVILGMIRGLWYEPIALFSPVANLRVVALLAMIACLYLFIRRLLRPETAAEWTSRAAAILGVALVALGFTLITGETIDYFRLLLSAPDLPFAVIQRLQNLQQLSLSGAWLVLSVALMGVGIWRGLRLQRIVAFALFGVTIVKIFIYDLSFLQMLYRIFSFAGLGVILFAVSYAYQRYKDLIFGSKEISRS